MSADSVTGYDASRMSGCIDGCVPQVTNYFNLVLDKTRVKVLDNEGNVTYGYSYSYNPAANTFAMLIPDITGETIREDYDLSQVSIFNAENLTDAIPRALDTAVIINNDFYAIINNNYPMFSIWVGPENRVYYSEDIQSLIHANNNQYITLI